MLPPLESLATPLPSLPVETIAGHDNDDAIDLLRRDVAPGDVVLVKASRAVGLERVAQALLGEAT